jgi:hypothetical protein
MARLKNPSDAPAPAQGGKDSARVPDATTAARQALEQAHDTKKLLVLELLEKVGDAELQRAGPKTVSNVVKNTLDGIAGKEGRKYAEKVESGLQAEINAMQEDVRRGIEGGET